MTGSPGNTDSVVTKKATENSVKSTLRTRLGSRSTVSLSKKLVNAVHGSVAFCSSQWTRTSWLWRNRSVEKPRPRAVLPRIVVLPGPEALNPTSSPGEIVTVRRMCGTTSSRSGNTRMRFRMLPTLRYRPRTPATSTRPLVHSWVNQALPNTRRVEASQTPSARTPAHSAVHAIGAMTPPRTVTGRAPSTARAVSPTTGRPYPSRSKDDAAAQDGCTAAATSCRGDNTAEERPG